MSTPLLRLEQASLSLSGRLILDAVSLQVEAGRITTLIGPNGAGKTSLVKLALGLHRPTAGTVWRKPSLRIGYMPQKLQLDATLPLSVGDFLDLAGSVSPAQIAASLAETGVPELAKAPLHSLSGGELQRVLLARALLREPELLVLDEPVQGVDVLGQTELYRLIGELRNRHACGVLMISHDLHLVMAATDEVVCLDRHVCCHGHPDAVSQHPAYLELFGRSVADGLAVFTHHHDHVHDCAEPSHHHGHGHEHGHTHEQAREHHHD
ncbi:MAG: ATP-binding cassette domain-containing protein [Gammaproteobacteria bacterium]|nr:ATP-binding cassette domain-containing protein [Gammaproteobacteria bacterium]